MRSKKAPLGAPLWLKLSGFVNAYSSLLLTQMILTGYLFYPTIEKTFVAKYNAYWLMFSLFVMGLAINFEDWKRIVKSPKVIGFSALVRWTLMPLASYAVGYLVFIMLIPGPTGKALAVGMIILGCSPTGTTSNALTMIAKGDLALSVSVTTVNTLLAPFLLPVLMQFLAGSITAVDTGALFVDLVRMVIVPIASGSILGSVFVRQCTRMKPTFTPLAIISLGLVMMASMSKGTSALLSQLYILLYAIPGCVLLVMIGYLLGFLIPKPFGYNLKQRIAICFEVGVANATLVMILSLKYFGPLPALVCILFGKIEVIIGSVVIAPLFGDKEAAGAEAQVSESRGAKGIATSAE
jgi:BASS family bile acid:Na+ symporter